MEIWAAVSRKLCKVCRVLASRHTGLRWRPSFVTSIEFSQRERREPDSRKVIVEIWREVPVPATFPPRLGLLGWRLLLWKVVCSLSLSVLRSRHDRPSRAWTASERDVGVKEGLCTPQARGVLVWLGSTLSVEVRQSPKQRSRVPAR